MIYDTLFALDGNLEVKPQMVDKWTTSDDKLTWTFTLRDGLEFHDGAPVTADDVVPSLKRWAVRDALGPDAVDQGRRGEGARSQDLPDPAQGADRHHAAGAGQALGRRLHHAQEGRRDRSLQADRGLHRLRSLHLREGRVEARRQDGLRQEPQVQAAVRAAVRPGRRQDRQGRSGRMGGDARSADGDERAAEGRDRHDRIAAARPLQGHGGRPQRQAGQPQQVGQPVHLPLQPALQAVRQPQDPPGRCSMPSTRRTFSTA